MHFRVFHRKKEEVAPSTVIGMLPFPLHWSDYEWFNELPADTCFALWMRVPSTQLQPQDLPPGHSLYVVSFHYEHVDCAWLIKQLERITAPVIVLNDGSSYNYPWPSNVYFYNFYSWHIHLEQIMNWHPIRQKRNLKYKISAVCNRITQSKLIVTTALLESFPQQELYLKLGTWLEEKDIHFRQPTGVEKLDELADIFHKKYLGQEILIDDFVHETHNFQRVNSNPWQPLYLESAIHFTNQSYSYSLMNDPLGIGIRPGPTIDEKTFKCLLAATPFISVAQFDVYNQLSQLGLKFDYGPINLDWDQDPGNLSRLCSIVDLIMELKNYSIEDIDVMTKTSSEHNADYIWSGDFLRVCRNHNQEIAQNIIKTFG